MSEIIRRILGLHPHKWKLIDRVRIETDTVTKTELTLQCEVCGKIKYKRPSSFA